MSLAIAWGDGTYYPRYSPFLPGTQGQWLHDEYTTAFRGDYIQFGLTEPPGDAEVVVSITFSPAGGGTDVTIGTVTLLTGSTSGGVYVDVSDSLVGSYKLIASIGGVPLSTALIVTLLSGPDPRDHMYGELAWHEESVEVPPTIFWTRHNKTQEIN